MMGGGNYRCSWNTCYWKSGGRLGGGGRSKKCCMSCVCVVGSNVCVMYVSVWCVVGVVSLLGGLYGLWGWL